MRIRTIKPEFWQNRELAELPALTRLMALALLNWADDEGWFKADPALIRGSLFPFEEDSGPIQVALRELSRIEFIRVVEVTKHGPLGHVVNFRKHQRINKPQPSRLALPDVFTNHSGNATGIVTEASRWEGEQGRGMEEEQGREGKPPAAIHAETPSALSEASKVNPMLVEDPKLSQKKEEAGGGNPPDLVAYLGMAEAHAQGNPDGFVIPPSFVRWWHGLRLSRQWERANGVPIPNSLEARWSDLLTMARDKQREGTLMTFVAGGNSPAAKKKEAAARMADLLSRPPIERWAEWARENLNWLVDDDAEWQTSEASARKELWAAWTSHENAQKQAA